MNISISQMIKRRFVSFSILLCLLLGLTFSAYAQQNVFASFNEAMQAATDDLNSQNYDDANLTFKEAVKLAEKDEEKLFAFFGLAQTDIALQKFEEAHTHFAQALSFSEKDSSMKVGILSGIGLTFSLEGKPEKAVDSYREALLIKDVSLAEKFSVHLQLMENFYTREKFQEAHIELEKLHSYRDEVPLADIVAWTFDGKIFLSEGQTEKARENLRRVFSTDVEALLKGQAVEFKPTALTR